jgi:GT2 family glycosyltransferase
VRLIRNSENRLFAPACNQGLEAARGEFLLLLNPDCEARATVLGAMVDFLRANPRTGALGVALVGTDGKPQLSAYTEPGWLTYWTSHSLLSGPFSRRKLRAAARLAKGQRQASRRVDWIIGACLMVPRGVYQAVGALDPEYGMYSEDVDWCRRIRKAGRPVVQIPTMTMVHHQGSSSRRRPEFAFRRLYRSMLRYTLKHHGAIESRLLRASVLLDMALRVPIHACQLDRARLRSVLWVMRLVATGNEHLPDTSR